MLSCPRASCCPLCLNGLSCPMQTYLSRSHSDVPTATPPSPNRMNRPLLPLQEHGMFLHCHACPLASQQSLPPSCELSQGQAGTQSGTQQVLLEITRMSSRLWAGAEIQCWSPLSLRVTLRTTFYAKPCQDDSLSISKSPAGSLAPQARWLSQDPEHTMTLGNLSMVPLSWPQVWAVSSGDSPSLSALETKARQAGWSSPQLLHCFWLQPVCVCVGRGGGRSGQSG